ncbi:MAG: cyclic nucleotide-binding domain-containing protein [Thermodesulfobacteriota bacterium]
MRRPSKLPTPPQKKILVLLFAKEFAGQPPPTYREIAAELGWRAAGTVRDHVGSLVRKGFLSRSRVSRGLRLTNAGRVEARGAVPKSSIVQEGAPSPSVEAKEAFSMLSPYFRERLIPVGTVLWHKGDPANLVVAIDEGRVRIYRPLPDGNIASIFMFGPGDLFGFLPFLDGMPYPATAVAVDDVRARTFSREGLLQALRENPNVIFPLFSFLGRRLRDAFDRIEILSGRGVLPRVAAALVKLMPTDATGGTTVLHLPMPSGDFARTLGITPESFSRAVTSMAEMGLIRRLGRGRFQVLEPRSLRSIGSPSGL